MSKVGGGPEAHAAKPHSGLNKFKAAGHALAMQAGMTEQTIETEAERKPRFVVTDEGDFMTNIISEQGMTTASSLIGRFLGRSHMNQGNTYGKFCETTDVAFKGTLMKQGSWWHSWKERFFVLRKDVPLLAYYSSESKLDKALGTIFLHTTTKVEKVAASNADGYEFAFRIDTPEHTRKDDDSAASGDVELKVIPASSLLVRAASEKEFLTWTAEIMNQAFVSGFKKQYKNAELNWWALLFNDREVKSPAKERRRKGVVSGNEAAAASVSEKTSPVKKASAASSDHFDGDLAVMDFVAPSRIDSRVDLDQGHSHSQKALKSAASYRDIDSDNDDEEENETGADKSISVAGDLNWERETKASQGRIVRLLSHKVKKSKKDKSPQQAPFAADISQYIAEYQSQMHYDKMRAINKYSQPLDDGSSVASRSECKAIEGIQICLELKNLCHENERIYCSVLGYTHAKTGTTNKVSLLSRTETITVTDTAVYALSVPVLHVHFSVLQFNIPDNVEEIHIGVNREESSGDSTAAGISEATICRASFTRKMFESNTVFCSTLKFSKKESIDLTNPQLHEGSGKIGLLRLSSTELYTARTSLSHTLRLKPYSEVIYALKNTNGVTMSLEQLFASQYAVLASKSFLKLLTKERQPTINHYMRLMKEHKADAKSKGPTDDIAIFEHAQVLQLEQLISSVHDTQLCDMQDVLDFYKVLHKGSELGGDQEVIGRVVPADQGGCYLRRSAWKKQENWQYCTTNLNVHMLTTRSVSDKHILEEFVFDDLSSMDDASAGGKAKAEEDGRHEMGATPSFSSVTPGVTEEQRAHFRRMARADHKETQPSADMANKTHFSYLRNLKTHAARFNFEGENYDIKLDPDERIKMPEQVAERCVGDNIHFIPFITLGVPAAHGLGWDKGGLRSTFHGVTNHTRRVEWLHAVQHPSMGPIMSLRAEHPAEFATIFGKHANFDNQENDFQVMYSKFKLAKRIDMVGAQAMGFACTCIRTVVALAAQQPESIYSETVRLSLKCGWLLTLTSLLSTSGDELHMIEDLECAALWLRNVKVRFIDGTNHASGQDKETAAGASEEQRVGGVHVWRNAAGHVVIDLELTDPREVVVIRRALGFWEREDPWRIKFDAGIISTAPEPPAPATSYPPGPPPPSSPHSAHAHAHAGSSDDGHKHSMNVLTQIDLFCVAFSIGVNEQQNLANAKSTLFGSEVKVQADINSDSLDALHIYWEIYQHWWLRMYNYQGIHNFGTRVIMAVQELFKDVQYAVRRSSETPGVKHVSVLTSVSTFCRKLGGTIGILCKSGKDRTSMSVTLEMTRAVVDAHNVIDGRNVVSSMRVHGVRRMNVWGNTGQPMFAFNSIQRSLLPECYRPPAGTFSGSVNS